MWRTVAAASPAEKHPDKKGSEHLPSPGRGLPQGASTAQERTDGGRTWEANPHLTQNQHDTIRRKKAFFPQAIHIFFSSGSFLFLKPKIFAAHAGHSASLASLFHASLIQRKPLHASRQRHILIFLYPEPRRFGNYRVTLRCFNSIKLECP